MDDSIRPIDADKTADLAQNYADCVILAHDGRILMQRRPGRLVHFGGHVEAGEEPVEAMVREMAEELGARIDVSDTVFLGAVTEAMTGHTEAIHVYFWHDRDNTITGCYEFAPAYFDSAGAALRDAEIMDYAAWALKACLGRGLLKE